jgi:acyl-homoserine-lactone acylase
VASLAVTRRLSAFFFAAVGGEIEAYNGGVIQQSHPEAADMLHSLQFVCSSLAGCLAVLLALSPCWPDGADSAASLAEQVIIRRDTYGVPHILAATEEAAAFAMGYAQAEDHCVELARRLVSARGEEAKFTGEGVDGDFESKRYSIYPTAQKQFPGLSPLMKQMMYAYAAGVNRYVEQHRKELPAWIPMFDGVDVMARGRQELYRFAFNRASAVRALQEKYPAGRRTGKGTSPAPHDELAAALHWSECADGSNLWSIAGSRTTSGKPILLNNPHQPWAVLYWEAHVTVPSKINFYGSAFVGRPVLTTGFNEHLGWTHTVNNIDLEDFFALTIDPGRPEHYLFDGKSLPLTKKEVAVEVKGADGSITTQRRTYWESHLGPIVHRTSGKLFALKSAIADDSRAYEGSWYALSKAASWQAFHALLKRERLPMFNLGYADVAGNTFYLWNGLLPRRLDDGTDYRLDVPGDTGKYVWSGFHEVDELPQLLNPRGGYLQNCNDAPWWTSLRDPIDASKYPSYIEPGVPLRLRSQMSLAMLEGQEKFSLDDVMRLKFNPRMLLADRVKPALVGAIKEAREPSPDLRSGLAALEVWDNRTAADSRGGVLFQRFWDTYSAAVKQPFKVEWDPRQPAKTPHGVSDAALALKHLEEAVRWTRRSYGAEDVKWGDVHRIRLGAIDLPATGADGAYGLFHVVAFRPAGDGKRVVGTLAPGKPLVGGGDGFMFAVEFSSPPKAYSLLAYGETSRQSSPHSTDQAGLFARGQFKPVRFTEADIKANLEREYRP